MRHKVEDRGESTSVVGTYDAPTPIYWERLLLGYARRKRPRVGLSERCPKGALTEGGLDDGRVTKSLILLEPAVRFEPMRWHRLCAGYARIHFGTVCTSIKVPART
jgi:hypothetical protein